MAITNGPWINYGYTAPFVLGNAQATGTTLVFTMPATVPPNSQWNFILWGTGASAPTSVTMSAGTTLVTHAIVTASASIWAYTCQVGSGQSGTGTLYGTPNWASGVTMTVTFASSAAHYGQLIAIPGAQNNAMGLSTAITPATGTSAAPAVTGPAATRGDELEFALVVAPGTETVTFTTANSQAITPYVTSGATLAAEYVPRAGSTTAVAHTATLSTSGAWSATAVQVKIVRPTPVIPNLEAGQLVHASDLNALSYAADFVTKPPVAVMQNASFTYNASSYSALGWNPTALVDTDGMTSIANGNNNYFTVARAGYYDCQAYAAFGGLTVNVPTYMQLVTQAGPNNPAYTTGQIQVQMQTQNYTAGGISGFGQLGLFIGGVLPASLYPGDLISCQVYAGSASSAAVASPIATFSIQWVSNP